MFKFEEKNPSTSLWYPNKILWKPIVTIKNQPLFSSQTARVIYTQTLQYLIGISHWRQAQNIAVTDQQEKCFSLEKNRRDLNLLKMYIFIYLSESAPHASTFVNISFLIFSFERLANKLHRMNILDKHNEKSLNHLLWKIFQFSEYFSLHLHVFFVVILNST